MPTFAHSYLHRAYPIGNLLNALCGSATTHRNISKGIGCHTNCSPAMLICDLRSPAQRGKRRFFSYAQTDQVNRINVPL